MSTTTDLVQSGSAFNLVPPHRDHLRLPDDYVVPGIISIRLVNRPLVDATLYDAPNALVTA